MSCCVSGQFGVRDIWREKPLNFKPCKTREEASFLQFLLRPCLMTCCFGFPLGPFGGKVPKGSFFQISDRRLGSSFGGSSLASNPAAGKLCAPSLVRESGRRMVWFLKGASKLWKVAPTGFTTSNASKQLQASSFCSVLFE